MRLMRLASDAEQAVRELQQVRRGRVVIGANEAAVHTLLPLHRTVRARIIRRRSSKSGACRRARWPPRSLNRSLDFGVLTFQPADKGLHAISLGTDELVLLDAPAASARGKAAGVARGSRPPDRHRAQRSVAGARARAARCTSGGTRRSTFRSRCRASTASSARWRCGLGVAVLPRRCALTEIARGQLAAVNVPGLGSARQVRLVYRRSGELSHAAEAFLETVKASAS